MRSGHTLLELATVLLLLGMAFSLLHPLARRSADRMAVTGARERVVGLLDRARAEARASGASDVEIRSEEGVVLLLRGESEVARVPVGEGGVRIDPGSPRDTVVVSFDALGLGRVASRTLTFRKGEAEASLVLSSLGRATRR